MAKSYLKRILLCLLGLTLYGFGNFLGVKAGGAGTNAWNTLALGIADRSGITFGQSTLAISFVIILIDILGKGKLGIGTVLNIFWISWTSDFFLRIFSFLPAAENAILGAAITLLGQLVLSFASILYMWPALGCGPRDTLMVILGKRFPSLPIGAVKFGLEICVLIVGVLLGAPFGIGTVLVMALQAALFQFACRVCRFEPRDVSHEDLPDTIRKIKGGNSSHVL